MSISSMLQVLVFAVAHVAFVITLGLLSYSLGRRVTSLRFDSLPEQFVFCASLGLGSLGYLIFLLGISHLLYYGAVLALLLVICFVCPKALVEVMKQAGTTLTNLPLGARLAWLVGILLLLGLFVPTLYPPLDDDSISYHLAIAKLAAQAHAVALTPYLRFPTFPLLSEMISTLPLLLYDVVAVRMTQFLVMLLVAISIYAWGRRMFGNMAASIAVSLWFSNVQVLWLGVSADTDLAMTLFCTLAIYALWIYSQAGDYRFLYLSAIFFGFAAGTKYTAIFFIGIAALYLLLKTARGLRFGHWLLWCAITIVVSAPCYLRNFYYTHNPVFPFFPRLFGYSFFNPQDMAGIQVEFQRWGTGHTLSSLISMPWNLFFHQSLFKPDAPVSPAYFFLLPAWFIAFWKESNARFLSLWIVTYFFFWFFNAQIARYLLPVFPLFGIAEAAGTTLVLQSILRRWAWPGSGRVSVAVLCVIVMGTGWSQGRGWFFQGAVPVTPRDRRAYLTQRSSFYPFYEFLNRSRGSNYVVYDSVTSAMQFHARGQIVGDFFGPARYRDVVNLGDSAQLYRKLRDLGAQYLLLDKRIPPRAADWDEDNLLGDDFFRNHFKQIMHQGDFILYQLSSLDLDPRIGAELLRNGSFEQLVAGLPSDWIAQGAPVIQHSRDLSHSGEVSVLADGNNWLSQRIPVRAGAVYLLQNCVRGAGKDSHGRLQVNWIDPEQQRLLRADIETVKLTGDWQCHRSLVTAAPQAGWAEIFASVNQIGEKGWFDDFSFREVIYPAVDFHRP